MRGYTPDPAARLTIQQNFRERHAERLRVEYREKYYDREKERLRKAARRQTNVKFRIDESMAAQLGSVLRGRKAGRSWQVLVGYTVRELMAHLESHFQPGMNWDNYGRTPVSWSIDHVVPKSFFTYDSTDSPEFRECWALENLRPMWWPENLAKGNRVARPDWKPPEEPSGD